MLRSENHDTRDLIHVAAGHSPSCHTSHAAAAHAACMHACIAFMRWLPKSGHDVGDLDRAALRCSELGPHTHLVPLELLERQRSSLASHHLPHRQALVVDGLDGGSLKAAISNVRTCRVSTNQGSGERGSAKDELQVQLVQGGGMHFCP